jgi:hypothetical protein
VNRQQLERELQRRLAYPYRWGGVQNDRRDKATNFIYRISSFDDLLAEIENKFGKNPDYDDWFNYALNRWYNFWSARAVEEIFGSLDGVTPAKDKRDRLVDFTIGNTRFDHKTTVFPKGFGRDLSYALNQPKTLIEWLYKHQSQEGRKHLKNRLFIVLHARDGQHWKLKAEISWLRTLIEAYVENFDPKNLYRFSFGPNSTALADIIWAVK